MIPEIILKAVLDKTIKLIASDYNATKKMVPATIPSDPPVLDESDTLIYEILLGDETVGWDSDEVINKYKLDIMKTAVDLFVNRGNADSRSLTTTILFTPDMMSKPCIHITSPSEAHIQRVISDDYNVKGDSTGYRMVAESTYTLLITSMNKNEVLIIYHIMQAMLMSVIDTFVVKAGFSDWEVSGQELRLSNSQAMHEGIYAKGINIKNIRSQRIRTPKMISDKIYNIKIGKLFVDDGEGNTTELKP